MVNYNNSKIYKIEQIVEHEEADIYFGSTTKHLHQRLQEHLNRYKHRNKQYVEQCSIFNIFEKYNPENCQIILIETVECSNKDELRLREAHYIKKTKCVNKILPILTSLDREERKEKYREKSFKIRHTDEFRAKAREKQKTKEYLDSLKIYRANKKSQTCECGCIIHLHMAKHRKTKKHIELMKHIP